MGSAFAMSVLVIAISFLLNITQMLALDTSCPQICLNKVTTEVSKLLNVHTFCLSDNNLEFLKQFETISMGLVDECTRGNFSKHSTKSVIDELDGVELSFEENDPMMEGIVIIVAKSVNECSDWFIRMLKLFGRNAINISFKRVLEKGGTDCARCKLNELSCMQNSRIKAIMMDEISFDSDAENEISENCQDTRPNWCKKVKSSNPKKIQK